MIACSYTTPMLPEFGGDATRMLSHACGVINLEMARSGAAGAAITDFRLERDVKGDLCASIDATPGNAPLTVGRLREWNQEQRARR